ncbi:hypothetical protein A3A74_08280 [Candidatus Roizmanbacteria bacterium RIFCSPLOWO2_01_FULL_35_13]|uniref:DUF2933 domain-containing protein n=1 Tax=Candidatus Roizmanbacteria bacterium RIFCSPLOWO2_01_FULL_35_13 TaxID=1802055 RepID=A0A1F7I6R9_9BACT|nr:MAG: hypothetical protein A3A74_08280 [Candidatus Roizmanbacteria bacterium RIFCSPLOWO2_01_FULL_35_13]
MNKLFLICTVGIVAGLIAVTVFKIPLNSVFLFGVLLACPLMHFFMGHGEHSKNSKQSHH